MRLDFSPRAFREANRCDRWWREHRPAARLLFDQELRQVLDGIRSAPNLGSTWKAEKSGREYRRLLMPMTRHHIYYSIGPDYIRVHSVWSAVRGRGPRL